MSESTPSLDDLRQEIDEIDAALHDLLMRRARVVQTVALAKPPGRPFIRPGREAQILRRLAQRHQGVFPFPAITRIWREMIAALTRVQGPFAVAVYAPDELRTYWDIARDHYGSTTPMLAVNTPLAALRCVSEGTATIAVVPAPEEDEGDPWWRYLLSSDPKIPRIISRLPFLQRGLREDADAMALGAVPLEPTGDDRTLLGIELTQDVSRGRLKDGLEASGLMPVQFRTHHLPGGAGAVHLVEVDGFVPGDDPRLDQLVQKLGEALLRVLPIGAYANPLLMVR